MDAANVDEALREMRQDIEEGADMVMVKPAGPFLDVIARVKAETGYPARRVPGERRVRDDSGGRRARLDRPRAGDDGELIGIRRAGADVIITYFAREAAARLTVTVTARRHRSTRRRVPIATYRHVNVTAS